MSAASSSMLGRLRARAAKRPEGLAFARIFAVVACTFLAVGATLPALPRYVTGPLGGGDVAVGVVIGAFAFSGVLCRPIAGRLADTRGRRVVAMWGAIITAAAGALLFVPAGVAGLIFARIVTGVGDGFVFTAGITWVVDFAPIRRRGQTIGYLGLAIWTGLSLGPLIGELLLRAGSFEAVWAFATVMPLCGAAIARTLPDRHVRTDPADRGPFFPRLALHPGVSLGLAQLGFVALAGFAVLMLESRGVDGGAFVFTAFAGAVIGARLLIGRLPDQLGPRRAAILAACAEAAGLAVIGLAHSLPVAIAGAICMGTGFSILYPSLALMVVERSPEHQRGAALGAFTAFVDIGVGIGGPIVGVAVAAGGYPWAFWVAAAGGVVAALAAAAGGRRRPSPAPA